MPTAPATGTDCCMISAPEPASQFTVAPNVGSDLSDLRTVPNRTENLKPSPVIPHPAEIVSWHSSQCLYDSPEKLSIFRI